VGGLVFWKRRNKKKSGGENKMKKGDVVIIKDGSWTRSIVDGELIHESLNYGEEKGKKYKIIELGCKFSNTGNSGICELRCRPTFNNTVIQAIDSGKVVFIEERFLQLAPKPIREVTMVEVCQQFGEEVKIKKE